MVSYRIYRSQRPRAVYHASPFLIDFDVPDRRFPPRDPFSCERPRERPGSTPARSAADERSRKRVSERGREATKERARLGGGMQ